MHAMNIEYIYGYNLFKYEVACFKNLQQHALKFERHLAIFSPVSNNS